MKCWWDFNLEFIRLELLYIYIRAFTALAENSKPHVRCYIKHTYTGQENASVSIPIPFCTRRDVNQHAAESFSTCAVSPSWGIPVGAVWNLIPVCFWKSQLESECIVGSSSAFGGSLVFLCRVCGVFFFFFPFANIPVIALRRPSGGRKRLKFAHTLLSETVVLFCCSGREQNWSKERRQPY